MPKSQFNNSTINWAKYPHEPYGFQREIVEQTWNKPSWAFFMEMGTGKSFMMVATIVELYLTGQIDTVLYVAKKGELSNFQVYEIPKHKPPQVECTGLIYDGYASAKNIQKIKHILAPKTHLRVFSMNIESLRAGKGYQIAEAYVRSSKKVLIIVDESTTLKDRRSTQHKALVRLRQFCKFARIATGTVMPHNPTDVYCQSIFLNKTIMGYGGVTAFRGEFCEMERMQFGARSFNQMVGVKNLTLLRDKMKLFGTVMNKADCLDLPDKIYKKHAVRLTDEQEKHYQDLVDFAVTQVDGEYVECTNALSVVLRLHQIVCGQLKMPEGGYKRINNNRIAAAVDICNDTLEYQQKIVVWSHYKEATAALHEALHKGVNGTIAYLRAGLGIDERAHLIQQFKEDEDCRIFLGNPQSSGFGLTLTEAHAMLYYSNSDNYEHRLQSEDRIHRIGQTQKCLYTDLHTPKTVEDAMLNRSVMKGLNRDQVMKTDDFLKLIQLG